MNLEFTVDSPSALRGVNNKQVTSAPQTSKYNEIPTPYIIIFVFRL